MKVNVKDLTGRIFGCGIIPVSDNEWIIFFQRNFEFTLTTAQLVRLKYELDKLHIKEA